MINITACIDESSYAKPVAEIATWVAKSLSSPLTFLHVLEDRMPGTMPELSGTIGLGSRENLLAELIELESRRAEIALKHGKALLTQLEAFAKEQGAEQVQWTQKHGNLLETLEGLEGDIRILVIGKAGQSREYRDNTIGSQLENVVRGLSTQILVATKDFCLPNRYLIAFDGSEISQKLIDKAIKSPLLKGLSCHLAMVSENKTTTCGQLKDKGFTVAAERLRQHGIEVIEALLEGEVHKALLSYQIENQVELIVMGAYGHSKFRQFFVGSNTTKLMAQSPVPILLLR